MKSFDVTEAISYIHAHHWQRATPGLSRIAELLEKLNNPQNGLRFIHIAGTNGKGSVSAMTESVLRAAGYRTGLFVSPFIKRFNERIAFCGMPIPDGELAALTAAVAEVADTMSNPPTEFELITAIGFLYFKRMDCQVVVLETGMGGRLDSTNIIKAPALTVITGIALDHTAILGDTVEAIAAEKAGILKKGAPMIWGGRDKKARAVIEAAAREKGVSFIAAEDTPITGVKTSLFGTSLTRGNLADVQIPLLGTYQVQNLATVLTMTETLQAQGFAISEAALRKGLAAVHWPGRFEKLSEAPLIIADGAHNPEGIAAAADTIKTYFKGEKVLLLTGVMADKDHSGMVATLAPLAAGAFTITPDNPRALSAGDLAAEFAAAGLPAAAFDTVPEAVAAAVAAAKEQKRPLIALGSLYMYAEITDALEKIGVL